MRFSRKTLGIPYGVFLLLFVVAPLLVLFYYAFTNGQGQFTLKNLTDFFTDPNTLGTLVYSLTIATVTTLLCLAIAYPVAYILSRASARTQKILITLIMIPMWMNFLIRTYAWMTILQDTGILNSLLRTLGLKPLHMIGTEGAVVVGMVYDYFPYMILPIYSVMAKMDLKLEEAARDLGCNSWGVLRRVIFPLSMPGVISGVTMVLIPSISTFYISQKLGNGKFYLIGDAIEGQYVANNLHFAAAIAFILMVILLAGMALMQRYANRKAYV